MKDEIGIAIAVLLLILAVSLIYGGMSCSHKPTSEIVIDCERANQYDTSIHFKQGDIKITSFIGWEQVKQFCGGQN